MANEEGNPNAGAAFRPEITRRLPDLPGGIMRGNQPAEPTETGNRLTVGRDIVLNGQITACDELVVEGRVEAALENSQSITIAETGFFKGSAVIEEATISGHFEGSLTVRGELTVKASGRVEGDVRYGRLCIESGGQIVGSMEALPEDNVATVTPVATAAVGEDG